MVKTAISILAFLTLLGDLFILKVAVLFILEKLKVFKGLSLHRKYLGPNAFSLSLLISLTATLGSLFFSEVAKFAPCVLCWYQRIFMYPQPFLLYLAILRDEKIIRPYLYALNLIGALIGVYQYILQIFPNSYLANCSISGGESCVKGYHFYFGYITIPLMAVTAFILNIILLSFSSSANKRA